MVRPWPFGLRRWKWTGKYVVHLALARRCRQPMLALNSEFNGSKYGTEDHPGGRFH
jgi:hypothetical protein